MAEHIIFLSYILIFIISIIGHGEIFSRIIYKDLLELNVGYLGIIGFFSLSVYSILSSFLFSHNFAHNIVVHFIGFIGFYFYIRRDQNNIMHIRYLLLLLLIFLIGAYVYKNHDDFPYYHLTYTLNLSENKFIIGTGVFSHGFRTFSSLFHFHSLLYMPYIKFYLFHIGPFLILLFFNYIVIYRLIKNNIKNNFTSYFSLLSVIFVNIVFYRLGEHGTDRSAQILLLLIFLFFADLMYFEEKNKKISLYLNLLLIIIFLASSMKAIYYMYLLLVPIILFKKKFFKKFFVRKNFLIIIVLSFSLFGNVATNYLTTGCILYPAEKTCIGNNEWSIPKKEVKRMKLHYEWWAKAGGGPGYVSEMPQKDYVKNFNWLKNWIDRHFFNKVSDTLFGLIFAYSLIYFFFYISSFKKTKKIKNRTYLAILIIPIIFLLEWFLFHPAMRYGGYVLIALPLIIFTSIMIDKLDIKKKKITSLTVIFLSISIFFYLGRNIIRLNKEINFYNYPILESPYFYIEKNQSFKVLQKADFRIYSVPNGKMCWAAKTPCSYNKKLNIDKFLGLNMVYRNDW
ncbi:hypothetical protein [Candidatus Pelagibacter communis]|uniref:hypothetical protein n=1 Tax=Candidatus Pelagibacter TaxID=198251 RepID=UPI003EE2DAFA